MRGGARSARHVWRVLFAVLPLLGGGCLLQGAPGCAPAAGRPGPPARAPAGLFRDVSAEAGIDFALGHGGRSPLTILETLGSGAAFFDADGDGWLDALLVGPHQLALYRNTGRGTFVDATAGSGLPADRHWHGIACGDYDNDGRTDLFLTGYRCRGLFRNMGGGRFREVTRAAGVESRLWGASASFVDVDRDGDLDLFVTNYVQFFPHSPQFCLNSRGLRSTCGPTTYEPEKPSLYINRGDGTFDDETARRGLATAHGNALGCAIADYDGDGWIDIAVANDQLPGDLFHNRGGGVFENVGGTSGTAYDVRGDAHAGMGIDWADYDRNGSLDLVVTTYQHQPTSLYAPFAPGLFTDICFTAGIANPTMNYVGFGTKFFDYDNDTLPDLVIANGHAVDTIEQTDRTATYRQPTQLFRNAGNGQFVEMTEAAGPAFTRRIVGRGLATGDYDNDGRVDLLIVDIEGRALLLRNETPSEHHWVSLRLRGTRSNRDGIGAHLRVEVAGRRWVQVASPDGSFMSSSDPRVHLGLGRARKVDRLEIRWPSGRIDRLFDVPAGRFLRIEEGRAPIGGRAAPAEDGPGGGSR